MKEGPPLEYVRPDAVVVTLEHLPESGERHETSENTIGWVGSTGNCTGNNHNSPIRQVSYEGSNIEMTTKSQSSGRSSVCDPATLVDSSQSNKGASTRITTPTSMDGNGSDMLKNINNRTLDRIPSQLPSPKKEKIIRHDTVSGNGGEQKPIEILRVAISASGSHAATFFRIDEKYFIGLWELQFPGAILRANHPYPHPLLFDELYKSVGPITTETAGISISWDGSQISVHHTWLFGPQDIFVLEYHRGIHKAQDQSQNATPSLQPSLRHSECSLVKSFQGEARFINLPTSQLDDDSERFVACDLTGFSVYRTAGQWEMLYHIPQLRPVAMAGRLMDRGLPVAAGSTLVLEVSDYQFSIWDLNTGTPKHLIDLKLKSIENFLSSDGKMLAIVTKGTLFLYATETGLLLNQFEESSVKWHGFVDGDRGIHGIRNLKGGRQHFIMDTRNTSRLKKFISIKLSENYLIRDIKIREMGDGADPMATAVLSFDGLFLKAYYLEDVVDGVQNDFQSTPSDASDPTDVSKLAFKREISYSGGTFVAQETELERERKITMDIRFKDGKSRQYWWTTTLCYFWKEKSQLMMVQEDESSIILVFWRLPQSSQDELELLFYWNPKFNEPITKFSIRPRENYPTISTAKGDFQPYPGGPSTLADPKLLRQKVVSYIWRISTGCDGVADAEFKYFCLFINQYPIQGNQSESLISIVVDTRPIAIQYTQAKLFLRKLLQTHTWVPLRAYSRGGNPVGRILELTKKEPAAIEVGRMLIDYSLEKAKMHEDLTYIVYLLECMDDLTTRYPDLALRITRRFSYIQCHNRGFIMDNHKIIHPPTLSQLWRSNDSKIYESRNPILQYLRNAQPSDPLNEDFTEVIFVAPIDLLWSFVPNTRSPCSEFPLGDPRQRTTWIQSLYHIILFNMNPFSHVYIRPRFYSLEILDNPAIDAVVQYKWNTFAYGVWMVRFAAQCLYSLLIVSAALMQVYHRKKGALLGLFSTIVVFSSVFLWLEFLQWRESWYLAHSNSSSKEEEDEEKVGVKNRNEEEEDENGYQEEEDKKEKREPSHHSTKIPRWIAGMLSPITGKDQRSPRIDPLEMQRSRSQYFRSPYNTLDLITYAYPLATSIHQILNTINDDASATTADFSFSVVFVFLNLLAELRVSGTMCKYITIMFGIFNEIKVFSTVLAMSTVFFTIAIIHTVHGRVGTLVNTDNSGNPGNSTSSDNPGLPNNFLGAVSTVYLMMGGRFDPLNGDLYVEGDRETASDYKNVPLIIMVMVYFTFSSILMLNVLIALINNAFIKADDRWKRVWLENRLRYVEIAENMSYHIPGFRETFNWFPKEIYYSTTPYQVKQYWRRVAKTDEEIILEDDPIHQSPEATTTVDTPRSTEQSPVVVSTKELEEKLTDQNQSLHQDIEKMDQGIIGANKEISKVQDDLAEMKMAISKTNEDVPEMKERVFRMQSDINAILEALRGIQRQ